MREGESPEARAQPAAVIAIGVSGIEHGPEKKARVKTDKLPGQTRGRLTVTRIVVDRP